MIAVGHIVSSLGNLVDQTGSGTGRRDACSALGGFNVFMLVASNMWYLVLAVDLVKAIRNPFK